VRLGGGRDMTRLALAFALMAAPVAALPATTDPVDVFKTDAFHNRCIPESKLDLPSVWEKGGRLPPSCLPRDVPRDPKVFAEAWGRELTEDEWDVIVYRWFRANDPDKVLFVRPDDPVTSIPAVPVPPAMVLLAGAVVALRIVKGWK